MSDIDFKKLSREMAGREGLGGSTIMFTIIALVGLALVWANWAELDNVTRGEGRIVSSVQNQMVQASEGGVILRRYVSENTVVAEGEVLFEIDPVDASSELNRLAQRLAGLDIKELRLRAEINGSEFSVTAELNARSPMVALTEQSLFAARRAELAGQLAVLEQRLQQRQQDLRAAENSLGTAERTAGFLEEEIAVVAPLVRDNIAPTTRLWSCSASVSKRLVNATVAVSVLNKRDQAWSNLKLRSTMQKPTTSSVQWMRSTPWLQSKANCQNPCRG